MTKTIKITWPVHNDIDAHAQGFAPSVADYGWDTPLILEIDNERSALEAETELADTLVTAHGFTPEEAARLAAGE